MSDSNNGSKGHTHVISRRKGMMKIAILPFLAYGSQINILMLMKLKQGEGEGEGGVIGQ